MEKSHSNPYFPIDPISVFGPVEDQSADIIKVVGVGGGGCNAVDNMYEQNLENVTFAVCNTDSKTLTRNRVPTKVMLGEGLGAGGKADIGRKEAMASIDKLERLFDDGTKMAFITASMGGGTGTGSAPIVAGVARKMGILTIGVITIPFYFEKRRKIINALKGVDEMRKNVDALLVINNERIGDVYADSDVSLPDALRRADEILKNAVKGIAELITIDSCGGIALDFRDVESTMRDGGGAIMAIGRAKGEHRIQKAIIDALDSPLISSYDIGKAKRILFNIYSSNEVPFLVRELQEIDDFFDRLDPNIDVIWGIAYDQDLGADAKVTILATGMEEDGRQQEVQPNDDEYYENLITKLYKPIPRKPVKVNDTPAVVDIHPQPVGAVTVTSDIENGNGDMAEPIEDTSTFDNNPVSTVTNTSVSPSTTSSPGTMPHNTFLERCKQWLNGLVSEND